MTKSRDTSFGSSASVVFGLSRPYRYTRYSLPDGSASAARGGLCAAEPHRGFADVGTSWIRSGRSARSASGDQHKR